MRDGDTLELVNKWMGLQKISLTRDGAAEKCPDARRVAPISARVFYQIDRLKSGFEAM